MLLDRAIRGLLLLALPPLLCACPPFFDDDGSPPSDANLRFSRLSFTICWPEAEKADAPRAVGSVTIENTDTELDALLRNPEETECRFADFAEHAESGEDFIRLEPGESVTLSLEATEWFEAKTWAVLSWIRPGESHTFRTEIAVTNDCPPSGGDGGGGGGGVGEIRIFDSPLAATERVRGFASGIPYLSGGVGVVQLAGEGGWAALSAADGSVLAENADLAGSFYTDVCVRHDVTSDFGDRYGFTVVGPPGTSTSFLDSTGAFGWSQLSFNPVPDHHLIRDPGKAWPDRALLVDALARSVRLQDSTSSTLVVSDFDFTSAGESGIPVGVVSDVVTTDLYVLVERQSDANRGFLYRKPAGAPLTLIREVGAGPRGIEILGNHMATAQEEAGTVEIFLRGVNDRFAHADTIPVGPAYTVDLRTNVDGKVEIVTATGDRIHRFLYDSSAAPGSPTVEEVAAPPGLTGPLKHIRFFGEEGYVGSTPSQVLLAPDWAALKAATGD